MPIKSKAQRRKFAELLVKGDISPETFERWNREAGGAELPERLHPEAGAAKRKATTARKAKTTRKTATKRTTTAKKRTAKAKRRA